jgi:hypothetical protein
MVMFSLEIMSMATRLKRLGRLVVKMKATFQGSHWYALPYVVFTYKLLALTCSP